MSSLRLATAANIIAFRNLVNAFNTSQGKWAISIDGEALEDEIGRFRVWAGNLGALQKGHSSLDYRLRDSPVLSNNALKLLRELEHNLNETCAVVSGVRLPYEAQNTGAETELDDNDDGFYSEEEEDEDDQGESNSELKVRFDDIIDIIDNLYKLSVRIRTPTIRSRSLKASSYTQKDPETGVDVLSTYAEQDLKHVQELLSDLRRQFLGNDEIGQDFLIARLSASITLRRRNFKYWKRHRDKLAAATAEEVPQISEHTTAEGPSMVRIDTLEAQPVVPFIKTMQDAPSQKTSKTLLSGTEATQHHQSLDEIVDTKSVTSYAATVKDLHGKAVNLPPPPQAANGDRDFECPYCWVVCPARYGNSRAWKTHLLQDLQPYCCTYPDCESSEQLFRSRREWAEHEASHRKVWRCPEHPSAIYNAQSGLETHFRQEHLNSFSESQLSIAAKVGETTTIDMRAKCPICYAPADTEGLGDFHSHIANHLERIATFALPHSREDDSDGASGIASRGSSDSQYLPSSLPMEDDIREETEHGTSATPFDPNKVLFYIKTSHESTESIGMVNSGHSLLSVESLQKLPDESQNRLQMIPELLDESYGQQDRSSNNEKFDVEPSIDTQDHSLQEETSTPEVKYSRRDQITSVANIPTLRSLYEWRKIEQPDQSYASNVSYNQLISIIHHDLTKLEVDAIVNNAPTDWKMVPAMNTLHSAIFKAGGPGLIQEVKSKANLEIGQVELTRGHGLPNSWVIHAAGPKFTESKGYSQFKVLSRCYWSALEKATSYGIRTIAFPCLGVGGCGFPPRIAARIALEQIRRHLDSYPEHGLERIVICVNTDLDEKAYMDFLPVFFPPTHENLEKAKNMREPLDDVFEAHARVQKTVENLQREFGSIVPGMETHYLVPLYKIEHSLVSIHETLWKSQGLDLEFLHNANWLCSALIDVCDTIEETNQLAKNTATNEHARQEIWDISKYKMQRKFGYDLVRYLQFFISFFKPIGKASPSERYVPEKTGIRETLEEIRARREDEKLEGSGKHLDEMLDFQQYQEEGTSSRHRDVIKLEEIPSVASLFHLGVLPTKPTLAHPSATFNQTVCLVREDIMKLEVDIMVNSTDASFLGMGILDRSVFKKGGPELMEKIKTFGVCNEGDVKVTPGYLLPAKHILHAIPPEQFSRSNKDILRNIYREILHTAVLMKATSVAIPSIGTGRLNHPRHDCAALAMEEVKRFLEAEPSNSLKKIIFVVYSSNDEFVYKSLLPVYFPPLQSDKPLDQVIEDENIQGGLASSNRVSTDPVSLLNSLTGGHHVVRLGNEPDNSRPINNIEEEVLIQFELHAGGCPTCKDISALDERGVELCVNGYPLAQDLFLYMHMSENEEVYSKAYRGIGPEKLDIPTDMFPISLLLLQTIEKSTRDRNRSTPFVSLEKPEAGYHPEQAREGDDTLPDSKLGKIASEDADTVSFDDKKIGTDSTYSGTGERMDNQEPTSSAYSTTETATSKEPESLYTQILEYLAHDLRSRPGSYVGRQTSQIAAAFDIDLETVIHTLRGLNADMKVHNTLDENTWVISQPPNELPVLQKQQSVESKELELDPALAESLMSHMAHMSRTPVEREGHTVRQLAAALQVPTQQIWPAIRYLSAIGLIYRRSDVEYRPSDVETWAVASTTGEAVHEVDKIIHAEDPELPGATPYLRVKSYLKDLKEANGGRMPLSNLAARLAIPITVLLLVLQRLKAEGLAENDGAPFWWTATPAINSLHDGVALELGSPVPTASTAASGAEGTENATESTPDAPKDVGYAVETNPDTLNEARSLVENTSEYPSNFAWPARTTNHTDPGHTDPYHDKWIYDTDPTREFRGSDINITDHYYQPPPGNNWTRFDKLIKLEAFGHLNVPVGVGSNSILVPKALSLSQIRHVMQLTGLLRPYLDIKGHDYPAELRCIRGGCDEVFRGERREWELRNHPCRHFGWNRGARKEVG
ncbi:meiosis-specific serine threonine- kinase mek1 [Pyrenophora seminiperda CCB06]|uniref:Meiosis-specific serine threonine-kinase mek1 n=1 Tax=Pyrenophora seminiperda CCB06 TaxID=1302712 RepID=A0A3M7MFR6_9PLEO|nr:meiosis-specific serine threonine- kinase mek1 [Pyrenophora seminiperda CCB06]